MPLDSFALACYRTASSSRTVDWGLLSFEFPVRRRSQLPLRAAVFTRVPVGCFVAVVCEYVLVATGRFRCWYVARLNKLGKAVRRETLDALECLDASRLDELSCQVGAYGG